MRSSGENAGRAQGAAFAGVPALLVGFGLLICLNLVGVAAGWTALQWATKPLLGPVLALYLWRTTGSRHVPVLAGLCFATAGDVALLVSGSVAFFVGIGFFLGAQLCWTVAFVRAGAVAYLRERRALCAVYLAVWAAANAALAPSFDPALAVAIAFYSLTLVVMALTAHVRGGRAALGGGVFVFSDLLIGLDVAGWDFTGRSVLVMSSYALALFLITTTFSGTTAPSGEGRPGAGEAAQPGDDPLPA